MQPIGTKKDNSFTPKWTHFPEGGELVIFNPLDRDVVFPVSTDAGRFMYVLKKNTKNTVQGGMVATQGVKLIVDELITREPKSEARIWDPSVRAKFEKEIILRYKPPIQHKINVQDPSEPIDLSAGDDSSDDVDEASAAVDLSLGVNEEFKGENHNDGDDTVVEDEDKPFPDLGDILAQSMAVAPKTPQPGEEDQA